MNRSCHCFSLIARIGTGAFSRRRSISAVTFATSGRDFASIQYIPTCPASPVTFSKYFRWT